MQLLGDGSPFHEVIKRCFFGPYSVHEEIVNMFQYNNLFTGIACHNAKTGI